MNPPRTHTSSQVAAPATTKKRRASTKTEIKGAASTPATKKARCAHRLEPDWVATQRSSPSSITNAPAQPSLLAKPPSSISSVSSSSVKVTSTNDPSTPTKVTNSAKKVTPAAPKKIRKLDKNRDATPEFRERIWQDRKSCTIEFTEEDWERKPKWASRVYEYYSSTDELPLHATSSETEKSLAGNIPSLSFGDIDSSTSSDIDTPQSFAEPFAKACLTPRLKDLQLASVPDDCLESSRCQFAISPSEDEQAWLKKTESWTEKAIELVYDEETSLNDWKEWSGGVAGEAGSDR
ncbi:hypothetical protein DL95DRAFT_457364 [Leptodontidium sp. 2 PMI_412]|nr:hypothetical protein DL95DRAFT_457364 [Leptodontidium sp. 2 PMI_412]